MVEAWKVQVLFKSMNVKTRRLAESLRNCREFLRDAVDDPQNVPADLLEFMGDLSPLVVQPWEKDLHAMTTLLQQCHLDYLIDLCMRDWSHVDQT